MGPVSGTAQCHYHLFESHQKSYANRDIGDCKKATMTLLVTLYRLEGLKVPRFGFTAYLNLTI